MVTNLGNLTSFTIPSNVTFIGGAAFADNNLTSVIISNGGNPLRVNNNAFTGNDGLTVCIELSYNILIVSPPLLGVTVVYDEDEDCTNNSP